MTRILKVFTLAALACLALGAAMVPAAQALQFHKPAESITITMSPDGTGKTSHVVFDFAGGTLTCGSGAIGEASVPGVGTTFSEFDSSFLVTVSSCTFLGQAANVTLVECAFRTTRTERSISLWPTRRTVDNQRAVTGV